MTKLTQINKDITYKPHQEYGIRWMIEREADSVVCGGILCDEMGLGKTIQMIGLIKNAVIEPGEKNLLITPVAVLEQWKKLAAASDINVFVPSTSGMSWESQGKKNSLAPGMYCIGYEAARSKPWLTNTYQWERLIYDEAHRLASGNTSTELAEYIETKKRWLLTGTPIVNKVNNLSTLLRLIGVKNISSTNIVSLSPSINKYVLARNMEQLRASIPDAPKAPIHQTIELDFLTKEEEIFYHTKVNIISQRLSKLGTNSSQGATIERLKLIMRLRQVSLHPQIYNESRKKQLKSMWTQPDWLATSTKFEAIRKQVLAKESHKWIIFCHFKHEMQLLEELLKGESAIELVQQYHGGLSSAQREQVIDKSRMPIMEGKQEVLLIQLQSGGTGLNLQHFDRIIFTGPWWTTALMNQAIGRAVRIGQTQQVLVYHIHLKVESDNVMDNIDRFIAEKAKEKGELCAKALQMATSFITPADLNTK